MNGLKRVLLSVTALVLLGSLISLSAPKPVRAEATVGKWVPGVCHYVSDGVIEFCQVFVYRDVLGTNQGYNLRQEKWYWCEETGVDTNAYECIADIEVQTTRYPCGQGSYAQSYTDKSGVRWTCLKNHENGHYFWITTQMETPPCNEQNAGRIWAPGDGNRYLVCFKHADGTYGWVDIPNPFDDPDAEPYLLPRFSPNPGVIIIEEAGDNQNSMPSRFKWNAGSGKGLVDKFKVLGPSGTVLSTIPAISGTEFYTFDTITYPSLTNFKVTAYKPDGSGYFIGEAKLASREPLVKSKPGNMSLSYSKTTYGTNTTSHQFSWYNGDSAITRYEVYRNGERVATPSVKPLGWDSFTDYTLPPPTSTTPATYYYSVIAYRGSAAPVGLSNNYTFSLSTVPQKPRQPYSYNSTDCSNVMVGLSWFAADDDGGVTGYNVYRDGVKIATAPPSRYSHMVAPGYDDRSAKCPAGSEYGTFQYKISAIDAEGNESPLSDELTVYAAPYSPSDGGGGGDM